MTIKWIENNMPKSTIENLNGLLNREETKKVLEFHKSFPAYEPTPLVDLKNLAKYLNLSSINIKDESYRFGLNAFKSLGATYAIGKYISAKLGLDISELSYEKMISDETRQKLGDITFYSATDGNHGLGVAWTANQLKQKSVIYMPKGSSQTRLENIKKLGADASITEYNYDDAVRFANEQAAKTGGIVIQDTAWLGYEEIPLWIMQGYSTIASEAIEQMTELPTHIFLQAGVGSFASSIQGYFTAVYGEKAPIVAILEAEVADCYYKSAVAGDGKARFVDGDMLTLMAGLACGEPNTISFEIIKSQSKLFASCPDWVSAYGMRILGNPLGDDTRVVSGESGAVGLGFLATVMENDHLQDLRQKLKLDENSRVFLISTEGATDPDCYRDIVWRCRNAY